MLRHFILAGLAAASAIGATPAPAAAPTCPSEYRQGGRPDDPALVVACLLERLFSQGSASLGDLLDDQAVLIEADGTPYPGRYSGDALRGFDRIFNATWRDHRVEVEDIYISEDGAVALLQLTGTLVSSGRRVEMPILERYRFAPDGRVTLIEPFYFDTATFDPSSAGRRGTSLARGPASDNPPPGNAANLPRCPAQFRNGGKPASRAETVGCLVERVLNGGLNGLSDLVTDDAILIEATGTPYPGTFTRDRFGEFDRLFAASWQDARGTIFDFYTSPTGAVLYGQIDAVSRVTGQRVSMRILERYVFAEDGRVSLVQPFYFDTAALPQASASSNAPQREPR